MYPWKEERGKEGRKPREIQETLLDEVTSALFLRRAFEKNVMESSFLYSLSPVPESSEWGWGGEGLTVFSTK